MEILFILFIISALIATTFLIGFMWSVKSGQYDDTYSPSVRILFGDEESPSRDQKSKKGNAQNSSDKTSK